MDGDSSVDSALLQNSITVRIRSHGLHALPLGQRLAFSVGHVLNDLCSSIWFTYLLVYLHEVLQINSNLAGVALLIGQFADGISTPFVGLESDRQPNWAFCRYGKRKTWHLLGTLCVIFFFPLIFSQCIVCENSHQSAQIVYYSAFIVIFQFGWAAVQISHLSLIPELTPHSNERCELNSWRYACTVASNITVYVIVWLVLGLSAGDPSDEAVQATGKTHLSPSDAVHFRNIVLCVVAIGIVFSAIFHVLVKEEDRSQYVRSLGESEGGPVDFSLAKNHLKWKNWFTVSQFYKIGLLYMGTRLCLNLTQVYLPFYLIKYLELNRESIAYIPLFLYCTGFLSSFLMKYVNGKAGKKITYLLGGILAIVAYIWLYFGDGDNFKLYGIYGVVAMIGVSGSTMLITSLAITNDLIGHNTSSGAFVFGAMSSLDKLSNGAAVMIIQSLHSCSTCGYADSRFFYRNVLVFVCGGATIMALFALALLAPHQIGATKRSSLAEPAMVRRKDSDAEDNVTEALLHKSNNGNDNINS